MNIFRSEEKKIEISQLPKSDKQETPRTQLRRARSKQLFMQEKQRLIKETQVLQNFTEQIRDGRTGSAKVIKEFKELGYIKETNEVEEL